jgi:hypothetical protein
MALRVSILIALVAVLGCQERRTPARFLIPHDYEGVVITVFGQEGYPELPLVDGFRIHDYPADGILITSSPPEFGWASDEVFDVLADGTYRDLLDKLESGVGARRERFSATGSYSGSRIAGTLQYYYKAVGTEKYWKDRDGKEYDLKIDEAIEKLLSNHPIDENGE